MHATLPLLQNTDFPPLKRGVVDTLQVNLGYTCNQSCLHCHVNAGPKRKEQMSADTVQQIIQLLKLGRIKKLDLTGGAPELNPHFRTLVQQAWELGIHVIDRCNLTILFEPGQEDLAEFLSSCQVEVVASMPCYLQENVDAQRGKGVHGSSIRALQLLNSFGYGKEDAGLQLNLMFNPGGAYLPPAQEQLQSDYKRELKRQYGVVFNNLYTLTNMPIQRFGSTLVSRGEFEQYMELLKNSYQQQNLDTVMCRSLVSIDWRGYLYDCDFNQILDLPLNHHSSKRLHISEVDLHTLQDNPVVIADHCYGCTAGQGSSCGGALT
jgi:radical SAM/Cys-rich protein